MNQVKRVDANKAGMHNMIMVDLPTGHAEEDNKAFSLETSVFN